MSEVLAGEIVESRTPEQWAAVVRSDLGQAVAGFIAAGQHLIEAKRQIQHGKWEPWCKDRVGISPETARRLMTVAAHPGLSNPNHGLDLPHSWQTLYELSQLDPPLLDAAILAGRVTPELERKQARALVIEYKTKAAEVTYDPRHGDFTTRLEDLEPGSVDAVITDPPYPAEHLPLYGKLSEHAARWLKPGGICAVMSGQTHLPDVICELATQLTYHWTMAYLTPGGQAVQVFPRRVNTFWKPVLVFRNGEGPAAEWFGDVAKSDTNDNDKRYHHWGQSESGMADLIKRLSRPGEMICDPFMGAGTTGVAALALGRSFVGCDVNADHVSAARERLEQTVLERLGV
jgi:site-specific DNA-methyltransferase (adenine-specific)